MNFMGMTNIAYCKTPLIRGIVQLISHFSRACYFRVFFEDANNTKISRTGIIGIYSILTDYRPQ